MDNPTTGKERKTRLCKECKVDRAFHETKSRRLRLKLEHSQLRVAQLEDEISKLREAIRIKEWKAASSVRPRYPIQNLPNELWREIFRLATYIDGPAFSIENGGDSCREWTLSSTTRRSIPLICRHWHTVGLEFLYERIVIQDPDQLRLLCDTLDSLESHRLYHTLRWIQGVELAIGPILGDTTLFLYRIHEFFLTRLPQDQITLLGIELLNLEAYRGHSLESTFYKSVEPMVSNILRRHSCIQTLHFPAMMPRVSLEVVVGGREHGGTIQLPHLQNLSLLDGRWVERAHTSLLLPSFRHLRPLFSTLRSVSLEWTRSERMAAEWLDLLEGAPFLERVSIGANGLRTFMKYHFLSFLHAVPGLKQLTTSAGDTEAVMALNPPSEESLVHACLEVVMIQMQYANSAMKIGLFTPLFSKLRMGHFPSLSRIVVQSRLFRGGCLDEGLILPKPFADQWSQAIELCDELGVELINQEGNPLYLWHNRHDIKLEFQKPIRISGPEGDEGDNGNTMQVDEEEGELSSDESIESEDTGLRISDDSEDEAYHYTFQPDLECSDLDMVSEPENLNVDGT
ncbi:hypothetical protein FRC20_000641 [Serendipita sp. 405]|nr:hypothetical protein FRC20_000641 [Serendipita sp. 405]